MLGAGARATTPCRSRRTAPGGSSLTAGIRVDGTSILESRIGVWGTSPGFGTSSVDVEGNGCDSYCVAGADAATSGRRELCWRCSRFPERVDAEELLEVSDDLLLDDDECLLLPLRAER